MFHKKPKGIRKEDVERFEKLLMDFYGKSLEESYELFRRDVKRLILGRDTNKKYHSQLIANLEDLVSTVAIRFARINGKLHDAGKGIEHFYGMLNNRVDHVWREELRRMRKPSPSIDDPDFVERPAMVVTFDRELEENEENAIKIRCYKKALASLPKHILDLLLEYYRVEELPPTERTEAHIQLALRQGGVSPADVTAEQIKRLRNNLDSKISKWRNKVLAPRKEKCMKREHSRWRKLF
jgi:hypothetical protein